jgi:radical SAM superfamily enzyme YgiQ (UPF0313 family)
MRIETSTPTGRAPGKLRVALISPKGPLYRKSGIFKQSLRYMPLTFPTLAALIPKDLDVELSCHDEGLADVDPARIHADLVGMTVITGNAMRTYELAAAFRARGIKVVLGGPHITLVPDDAAPHADAIVVGYAEETWPQLLRDVAAGQMKPRYDQAPDLKLTGYPLPDRTVLPSRQYVLTHVFEATRSCIHACEFCVAPAAWGRKPLQKPVAAVVDDIRRRRARTALFVDLNLISDREYACELFRALAPLRVRWYGLATMRVAQDEELLDLLEASGCGGLLIGFESIVPQNLRTTKKTFNHPDQYGRVVEKLHEHRMAVQGCFVFGMDEDTPEVCAETARLAVEIGVDLPRFAISTPFPGTPLYKRLEAQGRILTRDWELYDGQHTVFQPAKMSPRELEQATGAAWRHAYSWTSIARRLARSPGPMHKAVLTNLGYRHYAYNLDRFYSCDWGALIADPLRAVGPRPAVSRQAAR